MSLSHNSFSTVIGVVSKEKLIGLLWFLFLNTIQRYRERLMYKLFPSKSWRPSVLQNVIKFNLINKHVNGR